MLSSIIYYDIVSNAFWNSFTPGSAFPAGGVHLYSIKVSEHIPLLLEAAIILKEEEQERADKFRKEGDRNRFILGRVVLRKILAEILQCQPKEVPITIAKHKKPVLDDTVAKALHFSISHSGDYVLIGVSDKEVGVDIEYIDPGFDHKNVQQYSFNKDEISFVNGEPGRAAHNFYLLWTRKESLLKATGKGLTSKLSQITALDGKQEVAQEVIESGNNYRVSSLSVNDSYVASICRAEGSGEIVYWRW